jgi:hypothetical protein
LYSNPKVYLVLLESSCQIKFNEIYFIIFIFKVWRILNFEWILLLKIQTNYKNLGLKWKMKNELSVFTLVANNTCYVIYPWRKVICFVLSQWYLPNHNVLGYVMGLIFKMISMNRGALTWFKMFGVMVWTLSMIEPFFHWIKKNQD